jgi:hypothetical protein
MDDLLDLVLEVAMRPRFPAILFITLMPLAALAQALPAAPSSDQAAAVRAVAKAWSLPTDASGAAQIGSDVTPADLAAAALLWRNGGPPPAEGWHLRETEKTWESAARKAGVPVDTLLKEYRGLMSDQTREALAGTGEDWLVLAEIRTLERLTGRGARAVATELSRSDFQSLMLAALPTGGPGVTPPHPPAAPDQAPPNQWQAADPVAPFPGTGDPKNTGFIGSGVLPRSK